MKKNIKNEFYTFLFREKALQAWIANVKKNDKVPEDILNEDPACFIDDSFNWENSLEGSASWEDLNNQWQTILSSMPCSKETTFEDYLFKLAKINGITVPEIIISSDGAPPTLIDIENGKSWNILVNIVPKA